MQSVSPSVSPGFYVNATPPKPLNRILRNIVVKDMVYRCAYYKELLVHFFTGSYAPFERRNLTKIKYSTKTVCQRNSFETAQQNFTKLCIYEGQTLKMCIFTGNLYIYIFSGSYMYVPFELRNLTKIKYTTKSVCNRNSSKLSHRIS